MFFLVLAFIASSVVMFSIGLAAAGPSTTWIILASIAGIALILDAWACLNFAGRIEDILRESNTVDAFCWKFLPIRAACLKVHGLAGSYWSVPEP